jgi:hypothetical protein
MYLVVIQCRLTRPPGLVDELGWGRDLLLLRDSLRGGEGRSSWPRRLFRPTTHGENRCRRDRVGADHIVSSPCVPSGMRGGSSGASLAGLQTCRRLAEQAEVVHSA